MTKLTLPWIGDAICCCACLTCGSPPSVVSCTFCFVLLQLHHSKSLDWSCMGQVLRVAKVSGDDIRLNMKLYKACATDWKKFCKDVEPGHMRVQVRGFGCVSV